ncbi:hypothetical protein KBD75_04335 [Candidatus Woesebacteria bacterium]|nr:hypothetical protein [Candidatus Woesebacteria bacterium]
MSEKEIKQEIKSEVSVYWEEMSEKELAERMQQLVERKIGGSDGADIRKNIVIDPKRLVVHGKNASRIVQGLGILLTHGIEAEKRIQNIDFGGSILTSGVGANAGKGELISIYRSDNDATAQGYQKVLTSAIDVIRSGVKLTSGIDIPSYREA